MAPKKKEEEETYKVEKLVGVRGSGAKKEFLVKWKGYPASQNTWEPVKHLGECEEMMEALESKGKKPAAAAKKAPSPKPKAKSPPKREKTAGTRFMTSKPKRTGAGKRDAPEPAAPPAKKQKTEAPAKKAAKKEPTIDLQALSLKLMESITGKKLPKPEKPAKAGSKRKRGESQIVEVDKIVGMRSKKTGVQYHIEWKDGTLTWEPEDNVMDDDLVDEFEEAEQIKVYGSAALSAGSEIEVKNVDEGFANSWSAALVTKKEKGGKYTVEYTGFVDDDGESMVEEGLERKRLRLAPDAAPKGWVPVVGEIVEVNEDDCWWEARVEKPPDKGKATLKFRVSDEVKPVALGKKVRPCSWLQMES